ncbi:hypothetical protein EV426DRAFT_307908 [Tirmania nivea]|nr:hypothetical protein EV426DRAFT_307908 [Tirmania nivea]
MTGQLTKAIEVAQISEVAEVPETQAMTVAQDVAQVEGQVTERGDTKDTAVSRVLENPEVPIVAEIEGNGVQTEEVDMNGEASTDGRALTAVERTVMGAMEPLDEVPSSGTLVMVTVHAVERVEESNVLGLPAPLEVAAVEQATPMTSMAETLEMQAVIEQSTRHVTSDTRSITTVLPGHNSTIPPPPIDGTPEIPIREPTVHEASPAEAAGAMGISVGHNDELSMSYTGLPEVGIAPTPVAPTLVKRGRGRPRKYPLPLDADGNPIQPPKPVKKARKSNVGSREAKRRRSSAISSALREVDQGSDPAPIAPMEEPVAGPSVAPTNADGGVEINKEVIAEEEVVGNKDGDVDMDKEMEEDVVPKEGEANEVREVAETLPELRSEVHCEAQPETEPETQPEAQPETQPETQPEVQPGAQSEAQPGAQSEAQSEAHSEAQSEAQPEARPEAQPKVQPEAHPAVVSEPPRLTIAERLAAMTPMEKLEALRSLRAQRTPQLSVAERLTRMTPMERVKAVQTMSFAEMKEAAAWLETLNNGNKAPGVEEGAPTSAAPVEPSEAAAVEASEEVVSTNTVMESEAPITEEEIPREEVPENGGNAGITPEPLLKVSVAEEEPTKDDLHEDNTNEAQVVSPPVASPLKRGRGRPRKYPRPDDINGLPVPRTPKTPKKISRKTSKKEENKGEEHEKEEEEKGKKTGEEKEENDDAEGSSGVDAGETEEAATAVATVAALDVQANTTTTEILTLPIKRGRGRPRKHPRPEDVNGLPLPVQKKKRRRYIGGAAAVNKDKDDGASEEAVSIENSEQSMPEGEVHSGEVRNEEGVVSSEAVRSEEEPVVERGEGEPAGGRLTQSEEDIIARINGTLRRCSLEVRLPSEGKEDESQNAEGGVGEPETHEGKEDESQNAEGGVGEPETHEGKEDESQNAEGGVGEPETHEGKEDESQNAEGGVGEPETHEGKRLVLDEVVIVKGGADETMEESGEVDAEAQAGLGVKAPLSPTMTSPVLLLDEVIHPPLAFTPIPTPLSTTIAMPILVSPSAQTIMLQSIPTSMPTPSAPTFMPPSTLPPRLPTCPPEPHQAPPPILDYTPPGVVYRTLSAPSHWDRPQPPPPPRGHVESLYSNLNIPPDKMKQLEAWRNLGRAQINPPPPMQGCFNVNVAGSASASAIANGSVPFGGQFHSHKMPVPAQWPAQAQPLPPVQRQREGAKREGEMDSVVVPFPKRQNVGTSTQSALGMAPLVGIPSQLLGQMVIQPLLQWQAPESSIVEAPQASSSQLSSAGQTYQELPSQPSQIPLPQKQKTPLQLSPPSPHQGNQTSPPQNSPIGFEVPASPVRSVTIPHANGGVNGHWMEIQLSPASEAPAPQAHVRKESYPVPSPPSQKKNAPYRPPLSTPPTPAAGFLDTKTISTTFHAEAAGLEDSPDGSMDKPKRTRKSSTGRVRRKGLKWVIYSGEQ